MFKNIDFRMIVAFDENMAIGYKNTLPWRLSDDLKHFKALTIDNVILMGRKTYESIGRPLPGRTTIILTRNKDFIANGCIIVNDLSEVNDYMLTQAKDKALYCVGGANLYKQLLPCVKELYITEVYTKIPNADAFFPVIDLINSKKWTEKKVFYKKHLKNDKNEYDFAFKRYTRIIP